MNRSNLVALAAVGVISLTAIIGAVIVLTSGGDEQAGGDVPTVVPTLNGTTDVVIGIVYQPGLTPGDSIELSRIDPDGSVRIIGILNTLDQVADTGLEPNSLYSYRVRLLLADGGVGEWSAWEPIATGGPGGPETTLGVDVDGEEDPDLTAPLPSLTDTDLAIRPTILDFGPVAVGESRQLEVAIFNNGDDPYGFGQITIAGAGLSANASSCLPELPGRSSCTVNVVFNPQDPGVVTGLLSSSARGALARVSGDGKGEEGDASLTISAVGSGTGSVTSEPAGISCPTTCTAPFAPGTTVRLTAQPDDGSVFIGWSGNECQASPICSVAVDGATTVLAVFDPAPPSASLTVDVAGSGSGKVLTNPAGIDCPGDCTEDFTPGTEVTLAAAAADGSVFAGWQGGGCPAEGECQVTVNGQVSVLAVFEQGAETGRLQLEIVGTGTGSITSDPAGINCPSGECAANFEVGSQVRLTPVADAGSVFVGWSGGGCVPDGLNDEICITTVENLTNILAEFATG